MNQFSDQLMYNILLYLRQFYVNDARRYVTVNDIFTFLYNGFLRLNIVLNQNQFISSLAGCRRERFSGEKLQFRLPRVQKLRGFRWFSCRFWCV